MRRFVPIVLGLMLLALVLPGAVAAKKPSSGAGVSTPITAPAVDKTTNAAVGTYNGTLSITRFAVQNGQLMAIGSATGAVTYFADGTTSATQTQPVSVPVQTNAASALAAGDCDILSLVLGPLHLDLLGLVVDLNEVHLDITAVPGAGNLLGNLLCAVAGLLDGGGPLTAIANLLNQILAILNGLGA